MDEVGLTAKDATISWPEEIPPKIPPAWLDLNLILPDDFLISSEFSSPLKKAAFIPDPIFTPLTALMLISAAEISVSNFEYMGAPKPTGIPDALNSITAPQEEPAFLSALNDFDIGYLRFFVLS